MLFFFFFDSIESSKNLTVDKIGLDTGINQHKNKSVTFFAEMCPFINSIGIHFLINKINDEHEIYIWPFRSSPAVFRSIFNIHLLFSLVRSQRSAVRSLFRRFGILHVVYLHIENWIGIT